MRTTYYTDFYSLSLIERIIQNIFRLSKLIFQASGATRILVIFFFCSAAYAFEKAKGVLRFILFSANALASALLLFEMNFGGIGNIAFDLALLTFGLDSILCLPKIFSGESSPMHFFTLMALVCQCAMLISPEMGPRTLLISIAFLFIPIALVFTKSEHKELLILLCSALLGLMSVRGRLFMLLFLLISALTIIFYFSKRLKPLSIIAALALIMLLSANSLYPIISGYAENYVYHKQNSILLDEYKSTMDDADGRTLEQHYLPNVYCKYTMPYDDPYHMHWYKIVKKIPIDTEIIYK